MNPFKNIRLAYIEDLDADPEVVKAMTSEDFSARFVFGLDDGNYGFETNVIASIPELRVVDSSLKTFPKGSELEAVWDTKTRTVLFISRKMLEPLRSNSEDFQDFLKGLGEILDATRVSNSTTEFKP